jgi:hypothetical protein
MVTGLGRAKPGRSEPQRDGAVEQRAGDGFWPRFADEGPGEKAQRAGVELPETRWAPEQSEIGLLGGPGGARGGRRPEAVETEGLFLYGIFIAGSR